MSSQLIFLVALVAGCSANPFIKANKALVDVPNLWMLEVDIRNTSTTSDLFNLEVTYIQGEPYLELEYAALTRIKLTPVGNNKIIDKNVEKDFDILIHASIFPQYSLIHEVEDAVHDNTLDQLKYWNLRRKKNDKYLPYSPNHLEFEHLPLWKMDVNKGWVYTFEGTIYKLLFSIRKF